jgi:hypothetical protein
MRAFVDFMGDIIAQERDFLESRCGSGMKRVGG